MSEGERLLINPLAIGALQVGCLVSALHLGFGLQLGVLRRVIGLMLRGRLNRNGCKT